ncbi:non-ribosomal peptide synthetase [Cellulomonas phragmiteti]|uniref:Phenyloxazoline synthase MbtB n=1 Tax=Cellulomonas phragmiteti TaxID=478780 RepID=A0ABQ4DMM0_9CELL|nr:non-ribosomal peptide synthetase [Cellulomonas phragmiteti]GIG40585.1 non-ribosomal peptide synthetase [Cellulomonas phragmiteti]
MQHTPPSTLAGTAGVDVEELLARLTQDGVHLWTQDGQLHFRAPQGTLTEERREVLRTHRATVVSLLEQRRTPTLTPSPATRYDPFPLTEVQVAYLVGRGAAYDYGGVACHAYVELELGELDPDRLRRAWGALVDRHDMLRAVVRTEGHQEVHPRAPGESFTVTDVGDADPHPHAERTRERLRDLVPDPQTWPLVRLHATRGAGTTILHLSVDLLVADHASVRLLLRELRDLYDQPDRDLGAPAVTFRDYVLARRALREGAGYHRDRAYWAERLEDLPPAPELPLAEHAADSSGRFTRLAGRLSAPEWQGLRERAAAHGLTPSAVTLAAYAEVVALWSRRADLTLNLPVPQRLPLHPDVDALVGDFTTLTLLAVRAEDGATFVERARTRQGRLVEDLDHGLFSGSEVLAELSRRRGESGVVMPVVFTGALGADDEDAPADSWTSREVHGLSQTPQVWLDCQVSRDADGLALRWDVREGVLVDGVARDAFAAYHDLLRRLATADDAWVDADPVTLPAHQRATRERVNATAAPLPDALLHEGPLAAMLATPDAVAVVHPEGELTHRDLWARVDGVAGALRAAGVEPGDRVAVVMDKGVEQVVAVHATSVVGAVYVPVDTTQPAARRAAIVTDAGVRVVLTQSWLLDQHVDVPAVVAVDEVPPGTAPGEDLGRVVGPDEPAYVIYTSGSTGTPKGVVVTHRAALNTVDDVDRLLDVGPHDRVLALAALGFDLSVWDLFAVTSRGGALVLPDAARRGDPSHWAELVAEHAVTLWNSVPAQMSMLVDYLGTTPGSVPTTLRAVLLSGDWIPVTLPGRIRDLLPGAQVHSLGGATEGAIWSIHHAVGEPDATWPSVPYGTPLANQTFHVLDPAGRDRPDWVAGELVIGGAGVALGYLGDAERTAARFVVHPRTGQRLYRTGDLGRYRPDGLIEFLGREDDQVKIRGHRVELAEIEAALLAHPGVAAATVLAPGGREDRRLVGVVETAAVSAAPSGATPQGVPADVRDAVRAAADATVADLDRDDLDAFLTRMRTTALEAMTLTLTGAGLFDGRTHTEQEVLQALRADRRHHRLVGRWLHALHAAGRLQRTGDLLHDLVSVTPQEHERGWQDLRDLEARTTYGTQVLEYMRTCTARLPELLRAELDVRSLLFPGASTETAGGAYRDNLAVRHLNAAAASALAALAAQRSPDRPLRVLEVGAGVGGTSDAAVQAIAGLPAQYLFTDLSPFFLTEARERFAEFPFVTFGLYDIERPAHEQGHAPNSFDVVVAANVLHDAVDVDAALARLREVLVPGGHLVVLETTLEHDPALLVSMELMEGLDGGHHDARTAQDQTFLTRAQWHDALGGVGAVDPLVLPEEGDRLTGTGQSLLVARLKTDRVPVDADDLVRHCAARLPEYMVPGQWQVLDRLPLTSNGKVDRRGLLERLPSGAAAVVESVSAAPADDLERSLAALWAELLERAHVGRDDDFFDLGGDSLLVARMVGRLGEVLPGTGEDIEWEVVLRRMLRTPTVAGLAEYLRDLSGQVEAAADRSRDPYVPLNGPGGGVVTALVHAGTGTLVPYRALITEIRRRSAGQGTLVGLELPDVAAFLDADPATVITRWAADYAHALLERGGDRFHVVGYCLGGLIATEVARTLTEAGAHVASLTAISTHRPPFRLDDELISEYAFAVMMGIDPVAVGFPADENRVSAASDQLLEATPGLLPDGAIGRLEGEYADVAASFRALAEVPRAERVARMCAAVPPSGGSYTPEALEEVFRIFRQSVFSISRYEPEPYAGDITFLRHGGAYPFPGNKESVTTYWERLVLGDLRIVDVPGDHFGMLSVPYAPGILTHLDAITGGDVVA